MNTNVGHQYRDILFQQFEKKKNRNIRYSLRAFARDLDVPVSRLSDVFTGKKSPSLPMANHLAEKLGLTHLQRDLFITSVEVAKEKSLARKTIAEKKLEKIQEKAKNQWTLEAFEEVSRWLDLSICVALSLNPAPKTPEELAELFGVCVEEVHISLRKLIDRKEVIQMESGWIAAEANTATPEDVPSAAIKRYHCEMLTKAKISLAEDPVDIRDFSSLVFSFDSRELPLFKKRIVEMRDQLMMEFGQSKDCDTVYDLSILLFPVSKKKYKKSAF